MGSGGRPAGAPDSGTGGAAGSRPPRPAHRSRTSLAEGHNLSAYAAVLAAVAGNAAPAPGNAGGGGGGGGGGAGSTAAVPRASRVDRMAVAMVSRYAASLVSLYGYNAVSTAAVANAAPAGGDGGSGGGAPGSESKGEGKAGGKEEGKGEGGGPEGGSVDGTASGGSDGSTTPNSKRVRPSLARISVPVDAWHLSRELQAVLGRVRADMTAVPSHHAAQGQRGGARRRGSVGAASSGSGSFSFAGSSLASSGGSSALGSVAGGGGAVGGEERWAASADGWVDASAARFDWFVATVFLLLGTRDRCVRRPRLQALACGGVPVCWVPSHARGGGVPACARQVAHGASWAGGGSRHGAGVAAAGAVHLGLGRRACPRHGCTAAARHRRVPRGRGRPVRSGAAGATAAVWCAGLCCCARGTHVGCLRARRAQIVAAFQMCGQCPSHVCHMVGSRAARGAVREAAAHVPVVAGLASHSG